MTFEDIITNQDMFIRTPIGQRKDSPESTFWKAHSGSSLCVFPQSQRDIGSNTELLVHFLCIQNSKLIGLHSPMFLQGPM